MNEYFLWTSFFIGFGLFLSWELDKNLGDFMAFDVKM